MENNTNFQTFHQMGAAISQVVRQATGREQVQNIDMDHVTVAQNHRYVEVDVSGAVVSFNAGAAGLPLEKCLVKIEPVQDLHGYDRPWPGGGWKNKLPMDLETQTIAGVTFDVEKDSDGNIIQINVNGTATENLWLKLCSTWADYATLASKGFTEAVILTGCPTGGSSDSYFLALRSGNASNALDTGTGITITNLDSSTYYPAIFVSQGYTANDLIFKPMLRPASVTDATFAPYSNICPISGWDGVRVFVSPTTDAADGQTYNIAFPFEAGTVYGGTLDAVTGALTVDMAMVDLGTLSWTKYGNYEDMDRYITSGIDATVVNNTRNALCSMYPLRFEANGFNIGAGTSKLSVLTEKEQYADAASFKSAMSGVQLVYELATPIEYTLTPQEIVTLLGANNIWADTGDIEVKFTDIKELY